MKRLVKFSATWCGPCQGLAMTIAGAGDKITVPIEEVDIDKQMDVAINAGVRGVPTLIMFDDDKELKRHSGVLNEAQLLEWINN